MLQTIEAQIDGDGHVQLNEPVHLSEPHRAIVTILEPLDKPPSDALDFEADMEAFAAGTEHLPVCSGSYSREEIYLDHD
jgi:hypothetical protein